MPGATEENRLRGTTKKNPLKPQKPLKHGPYYIYNAQGERIIKHPQGHHKDETVYVNQYYTLKNHGKESKHIFIGTTRLVSGVHHGHHNGHHGGHKKHHGGHHKKHTGPDLYYYHPDHLGSTTYETNKPHAATHIG